MTQHALSLKWHFLIVSALFFTLTTAAQKGKKNDADAVKFGEITPADFDPSKHAFDSTSDAVVLYDKGYSHFRGTSRGWFQLIFERHQRIKVVSKNGKDAGDFVIMQYRDTKDEEKIDKLRASTFNLENGQVVETKLESKDIYKDQLDKQYSLTKFGMPNVKEGSIIEVSYTIVSDFLFNLRDWNFQGKYPVLHSEYNTSIPQFFVYVVLSQGYLPLTDKKVETFTNHYNLLLNGNEAFARTERLSITSNEVSTSYIMKNVPALKKEPFTSTLENHISKINFQLKEYRFPEQEPYPVMASWPKVNESLLNDEEFGGGLKKNNGWLTDEANKITAGAGTNTEKAKAIYNFMREKFTVSSKGGKYMTDNPKNIWKNMKGNTADANIMLTMLLRSAGLEADPVLLGTRDHGITNEMYPIMRQYNYVISHLVLDGKEHFLDCTDPMIGFGHLPLDCYNGHARLIKTGFPMPVYLEPDSIKESKTTIINMFMDEEKSWEGSVNSKLGYYESTDLREKIKSSGMTSVELQIKNALPGETEMKALKLEEEKDIDKPVKVLYNVDYSNLSSEDILYINPLLGERTKENPFTAAERYYPVEMPYAFKETIISNIKIPNGYMVDEIPKSARVKLEDGKGHFDYIIQHQGEMINMRCVLEINKATFSPDEYALLRDFFTYVVNKESEQVVLKKKP